MAVVVPESLADRADQVLGTAGVDHGRATRQGLKRAGDRRVTPSLVKGLELDSVIVVEPSHPREEARGRSRSTWR